MRWTVEGADKDTGQDRTITVEADTKAQAERIATSRGLLVSDIHKPVSLTPEEKLEEMVATGLDASDVVDMKRPAASAPINRAGPAPGYEGLLSGAKTLAAFGILVNVLGIFSVIGGIVLLVLGFTEYRNVPSNALPSPEIGDMINGGASLVASGLVGFCAGSILSMMGSAGIALRDIARNSFR